MNTSPFHRLIASAILICLCTCVIAQTDSSVTARRNADSIEDSGHVIAMTDTLTTDTLMISQLTMSFDFMIGAPGMRCMVVLTI